ncbi:MAG: type II toxin-antitoxin system RatA family toxin [Alphaproteobacteria bacterium]|nr:type II toxin-antitoxin system RatA family toxin [Alphaproteobacteria bacterium]
MFELVADVEKYPQFLPMCTGMAVRERRLDDRGREVIVATMTAGYKAISESFTSRVTLDRSGLKILVEYIDGPFRYLENVWTFRDVTPAVDSPRCEVDFFIDYEFKSRMLGMLMGGLFDAAFRKFAEAFEKRAGQIYGRGGARPDSAASA